MVGKSLVICTIQYYKQHYQIQSGEKDWQVGKHSIGKLGYWWKALKRTRWCSKVRRRARRQRRSFVFIWDMLRRSNIQWYAAETLRVHGPDVFERTYLGPGTWYCRRSKTKRRPFDWTTRCKYSKTTSGNSNSRILTKTLHAPFSKLILRHNVEFLTSTATCVQYSWLMTIAFMMMSACAYHIR